MSDIRDDHIGDSDGLSDRLMAAANRAAPKSPSEALQPETAPPPPTRSRAARHPLVVVMNFFLTVVIVGGVLVGGGLLFVNYEFGKAGTFDQARTITVRPGTGVRDIAMQLQREGAISSRLWFIAGVYLSRNQSNLKAGEYLVPANASMDEIMDTMIEGKSIVYAITVPEGLTSRQIVDRVRQDPVLVGDINEVPAEGALLPATYNFNRGDTRQSVIDRMVRERDRVLDEAWERRASDLPLASKDEMAVLASIVEKETALADERSRVAAVFMNRLRLNMRLQTDPTVIYGLFGGEGKPSGYALTRGDLDKATPYNTYVIDGLPPGPIANAGEASFEAVANPSRTRDLFFVADGSGGHAFAETYEEHLENVARWREYNRQLADQATNEDAGPAEQAEPVAPTE